MTRPTRDQWAMEIAEATSKRSTCCRRYVGCVLVNARGHMLSTGYNGVAAGMPHCNEPAVSTGVTYYPNACPGSQSPSGTNLDGCHALHAEQNALLQCSDIYQIDTAYVTTAPCVTCTKLLMNTSCKEIIFKEDYPQSEQSNALWKSAGRVWRHYAE
jgi:dCMP deaminase